MHTALEQWEILPPGPWAHARRGHKNLPRPRGERESKSDELGYWYTQRPDRYIQQQQQCVLDETTKQQQQHSEMCAKMKQRTENETEMCCFNLAAFRFSITKGSGGLLAAPATPMWDLARIHAPILAKLAWATTTVCGYNMKGFEEFFSPLRPLPTKRKTAPPWEGEQNHSICNNNSSISSSSNTKSNGDPDPDCCSSADCPPQLPALVRPELAPNSDSSGGSVPPSPVREVRHTGLVVVCRQELLCLFLPLSSLAHSLARSGCLDRSIPCVQTRVIKNLIALSKSKSRSSCCRGAAVPTQRQ